VTPTTGLIGLPEQTQNGLEIVTLLNPTLGKIGQQIKLVSDVNQLRFGLDVTALPINDFLSKTTAKLNVDGLDYVMRAEHRGDTRGTPWYTKLTCLAIDASIPREIGPFSAIGKVVESARDMIKRY
jgi:hypothetical protein